MVRPDVAVGVEDEIAGVVLNLHDRVLTDPETDEEDEEHPRRVAVELAEAARHETTEKHFRVAKRGEVIRCILNFSV